MKASVIIPTHNRADILARCLDSLTCQTLPAEAFEVLVIDNGSTDHTPEVARRYASLLQLTCINDSEPGLHVGRHAGMRSAKSDLLLFVDDDIEAEPGWVDAVVQSFKHSDVALVGGNNYPRFEEAPPAWLLRRWEEPVYKGRALGSLSILDFGEGTFEIAPGFVLGCNFSIRRHILMKAGGFHPDGMPKEKLRFRGDGESYVSDVVRSLGLRAMFNSRASVRHFVSKDRATKEYFSHRAYMQGISDSYTDIRRRGGLAMQFMTSTRTSIKNWLTILKLRYRSLALPHDSAGYELNFIKQVMALAYLKGYAFHQREVSADKNLLQWVLRETYLE